VFSSLQKCAAALAALLASGAAPPSQAATVTLFKTNVYHQLYGLTSDNTALYVSGTTAGFRDFSGMYNDGVIGRLNFSGVHTVTTLYSASKNYPTSSGHISPFQLVRTGSTGLLWADPDAGPGTGASFAAGTVTGGAVSQIFGTCCGPGVLPGDGIGVAVVGSNTYFSDSTGGRIGVLAGGSTTQIGPTRYTPDFPTESWAQITVVNGVIYMADSGEYRGTDTSGNAVIYDVSASLKPGVRWIGTATNSVFHDLSVRKIPRPAGIVCVGSALYVTSGNTIWKVAIATGSTSVWATDPRFKDLQGITFHAGAFYVADDQNVFGPFVSGIATSTTSGPGVIWKVTP
jgi:hypothetical protein